MLHKIFWFCSSKKVLVLVSKNPVYIIVRMSFPFDLLLFLMCNVRCSIILARLLTFAHWTSSTFFLPMTARSAKRILLILILSFCLFVYPSQPGIELSPIDVKLLCFQLVYDYVRSLSFFCDKILCHWVRKFP